MALDLTLAVVMRAAGPALFTLLGLAVMVLANGRKHRLAFGLFLAAFGAWLVASNLGIAGAGGAFFAAAGWLAVLATVAAVASLLLLPREERPPVVTLALLGLAALVVGALMVASIPTVLVATSAFAILIPPDAYPLFVSYVRFAVPIVTLLLALPVAWAVVVERGGSTERASTWAGLAAGILVFTGFTVGTDVLSGSSPVLFLAAKTAFVTILVSAGAWLAIAIRHDSRPARNVALAALGATLAGMLRHALTGVDTGFDQFGSVGIARVVGWMIVAITLVHAGWLEIAFLTRNRSSASLRGPAQPSKAASAS